MATVDYLPVPEKQQPRQKTEALRRIIVVSCRDVSPKVGFVVKFTDRTVVTKQLIRGIPGKLPDAQTPPQCVTPFRWKLLLGLERRLRWSKPYGGLTGERRGALGAVHGLYGGVHFLAGIIDHLINDPPRFPLRLRPCWHAIKPSNSETKHQFYLAGL